MSSVALQAVSGSDGQRPPKRRRDDFAQADDASGSGSGNDQGPADIVKSTRFWFPDGTIVVQAGNTQFRIHWGILSARSEVFEDMFRMPQPAGEPTVEGCPLVVVHDSAEDWERLLEVFYYSRPGNILDTELSLSISLLRLGKKYTVTDLANCAQKELELRFDKYNIARGVGTIRGINKEALYAMAVLVEELDIRSLLPALYYSCSCFLTLLEIADGYTLDDHTKLILPPQFRRAVLTHRDEFFRELHDRMRHLTRPVDEHGLIPVPACATQDACGTAYRTASREWLANGALDVVGALTTVPGVCETCRSTISSLKLQAFTRFYTLDMLRIFGLPHPQSY